MRWSNILMRHNPTASTLWTTSWWCTTKQIIPTAGDRREASYNSCDSKHFQDQRQHELTDKSRALDAHLSSILAQHIPTQALNCLDNQIPPPEEAEKSANLHQCVGSIHISVHMLLISVCIRWLILVIKEFVLHLLC